MLDSGRILVPLSYFSDRAVGKFVAMTVFSDDLGKTWQRSSNDLAVATGGDWAESGADEPVVAQLGNGKVWMLIRTQAGFLYESFSDDDGKSWEPPRPTQFRSSNSPASLLRLADGRIVVAWNNCYDFKEISYAREALHVAISNDDGKHWEGPKEVVRCKEPEDLQEKIPYPIEVCYPFLCEYPKGHILMVYWENWRESKTAVRTTSRLVRIDPAWIEISMRDIIWRR